MVRAALCTVPRGPRGREVTGSQLERCSQDGWQQDTGCHQWDTCVTSGMCRGTSVADDGDEGAMGRAVAPARGREGLVVTGERTPGSCPKLLAPGEAGQHHGTVGHEPPPQAPVSPPGAQGPRWPRGQGTPGPASTTCHQGI